MRAFVLGLAAVILIADQLTKWAVQHWMQLHQSIPMPGGFWALTYVHNTGGAFSIFKGQNTLFITFGLVVTACLLYSLRHADSLGRINATAFGLILGGAVGNLIDRIRFGWVVDFIDFRVWPVFNIADSGITVGIGLLLWTLMFEKEPDAEPAVEAAES